MRSPRAVAALGALSVAGLALTAQTPSPPLDAAAKITLPARITSLAVLNGSAMVVAGLSDGQVVAWNGRGAAPALTVKPHTARILAVGSDGAGRGIWSLAEDGSLARSAVETGAAPAIRRLATGSASIGAAAFSPDGGLLATGGAHGEIRLFDTADGALKLRIQGHRAELHSVALRSGAMVLASASAEADLRLWDVATGREVASVDSDLAFFALAFSPRDGTLAAGGTGRRLTLHEPRTFRSVGTMALAPPRMVATLAWSPDGGRIAVGDLDDETLTKGGIQVVDAGTRAVLADLDSGRIPASAIVFAANDVVIAAVGRELRAWKIAAAR